MPEDTESDNGAEGPIINEVLCFIMNKWGCIDVDVLTRLCLNMNDKEIEAAKDVIFNHLHDKNDDTKFKTRRNRQIAKPDSKSKKEKNLADIFCLLEEKGDKNLPDFVALDLGKLPPITYDSMDVTVLLRKIDNLECSVKFLMEGMDKVTNTHASIYDTIKKLDSRVNELESKDKLPKVSENEKALDSNIDDCERIIDNIVETMPFMCAKCELRFSTKHDLEGHNESIHESAEDNTFLCIICDYKCNTQSKTY